MCNQIDRLSLAYHPTGRMNTRGPFLSKCSVSLSSGEFWMSIMGKGNSVTKFSDHGDLHPGLRDIED